MSKGNKSARQKAIGGVNWWDYLISIRPRGFRNDPQYLDYVNIISRIAEIKKINKQVKNRKKQEKRELNLAKYRTKLDKTTNETYNMIIEISKKMQGKVVKPTKKAKINMLQYGLDICKWWNEQHEV